MVKNKHFLDPFITINRLISKQAVAIYNRSPIKFNLGIKQFVFNRKHNHLGGIANIKFSKYVFSVRGNGMRTQMQAFGYLFIGQ